MTKWAGLPIVFLIGINVRCIPTTLQKTEQPARCGFIHYRGGKDAGNCPMATQAMKINHQIFETGGYEMIKPRTAYHMTDTPSQHKNGYRTGAYQAAGILKTACKRPPVLHPGASNLNAPYPYPP